MVSSYLMKEHRALDELTARRNEPRTEKSILITPTASPDPGPGPGHDDKAGEAPPAEERRDRK